MTSRRRHLLVGLAGSTAFVAGVGGCVWHVLALQILGGPIFYVAAALAVSGLVAAVGSLAAFFRPRPAPPAELADL